MSLGPVLVVGTGLVGTSIGLALRQAGEQVWLHDRSHSHALVAAGLGAGEVAGPDLAPDAVRLVVVATPPDAVAPVVLRALERFPAAVVTDVASVKGSVRRDLAASGAEVARYVGSHPMAGSQHAGPLTAVADLFVDRTWVVTAAPDNRAEDVARVHDLATACGARVVEMEPDDHDRAVARVSHLPQLMSTLTAGHLRVVPSEHLRLAGQGIRDVTRIAGSDPVLWRQIIGANASAIRDELEGVRADLDELLTVLDDPAALEAFMARGRSGVRSLPGKHGQQTREWTPVVVEIPDTPGALARLFSDVGEAGVNVEDLTIEHDDAREVGFLAVSVSPEAANGLQAFMRAHGWTIRP